MQAIECQATEMMVRLETAEQTHTNTHRYCNSTNRSMPDGIVPVKLVDDNRLFETTKISWVAAKTTIFAAHKCESAIKLAIADERVPRNVVPARSLRMILRRCQLSTDIDFSGTHSRTTNPFLQASVVPLSGQFNGVNDEQFDACPHPVGVWHEHGG